MGIFSAAQDAAGFSVLPSPAQRANRRRMLVFLGVFLVASAAALTYSYSRPAEYRAAARVQINPGSTQVEAVRPTGGSQGTDAPRPFLAELQVLTSRPIVESTLARLGPSLGSRLSALGPDPLIALQSSLTVSPASGTDVIELASTGPNAEVAAALVNGVITTYKERLAQTYKDVSGEALAQLTEEVAKLAAKVESQRQAVEAFRVRHNVVSLEREENEVLSRVKGQSTALNAANEKLAAAEGKLRALEDAAAAGKSVVRARDNPTLANLEQRASMIREELRELERSYTPEYLAMDNRVRAQRARLAELEQQIVAQRAASQQASLAEAREEVATAKEAANRIRQQMAGDRGAVQEFSSRFNQYKALREDLTQIETLYRDASQRKARLEAGERARRPSVNVLEAATVPQEPWRPLYLRDAAIGVGASFILALLVMWVVELFNRHDPQPTILVPQGTAYALDNRYAAGLLGDRAQPRPALAADATAAPDSPPPVLIGAAMQIPRELQAGEIRSLLGAATPETRLTILLLLLGVGPEELLKLRHGDIDLEAALVRVASNPPRAIPIPPQIIAHLMPQPPQLAGVLAFGSGTSEHTLDDLAADVLYAAHDANIDQPATVTPQALRHTCIAFLARQGARLSDLSKLVGRLSTAEAAEYSSYAPPGKRVTLEQIVRVIDGAPPTDASH